MDTEISQEFKEWKEAQDALRAWIDANPKQPIPRFLIEHLESTQAAYEAQAQRNAPRLPGM